MPAEVHKDDVGTIFRFTFRDENQGIVNLSTQTTLDVTFLKGDLTTKIVRPLTFVGTGGPEDGTDGLAQYISISGDLDQIDLWEVQGHVVLATPAGDWHTDNANFRVHPNL